jgi:hypothetical protein
MLLLLFLLLLLLPIMMMMIIVFLLLLLFVPYRSPLLPCQPAAVVLSVPGCGYAAPSPVWDTEGAQDIDDQVDAFITYSASDNPKSIAMRWDICCSCYCLYVQATAAVWHLAVPALLPQLLPNVTLLTHAAVCAQPCSLNFTPVCLAAHSAAGAATPLDRAEWFKFVATYFNREYEAEALYRTIRNSYLGLRRAALAAAANTQSRTVVAWVYMGWNADFVVSKAPFKTTYVQVREQEVTATKVY